MMVLLDTWMPHLEPQVLAVGLGCWGFLVVCTVITAAWLRLRPSEGLRKVADIIRGWWWILAALSLAVGLGLGSFVVFMAAVSFIGMREFFALMPTRSADHSALFWSYGAILVQYVAVYLGWFELFLLYIPLYHLLVGPMRMVRRGVTEGFVRSSTLVHWALMLNVFCLSHLAYLARGGEAGLTVGFGLVLYLLMITELNDVAQFLWGKAVGNRKVLPSVSPNKTWGGLIGGVCTTGLLSAAIAPWLTPMDRLQGLGMGLLLGCLGFVGDVVMSAIKRDSGVKDTSTAIPGHGGVLDRVDSLTYTAPVFFYLSTYAM